MFFVDNFSTAKLYAAKGLNTSTLETEPDDESTPVKRKARQPLRYEQGDYGCKHPKRKRQSEPAVEVRSVNPEGYSMLETMPGQRNSNHSGEESSARRGQDDMSNDVDLMQDIHNEKTSVIPSRRQAALDSSVESSDCESETSCEASPPFKKPVAQPNTEERQKAKRSLSNVCRESQSQNQIVVPGKQSSPVTSDEFGRSIFQSLF